MAAFISISFPDVRVILEPEPDVAVKPPFPVRDMAEPEDIWFHVANFSSGHVILKNEKKSTVKKVPRQVIKRCACICKATIKAKGTCDIIYTQRKNVTKTDILGCVTTSNLKTVTV